MSLSRILVCLSSLVLLFFICYNTVLMRLKKRKREKEREIQGKNLLITVLPLIVAARKKNLGRIRFLSLFFILVFTSPNCKDKLLHNAKTRPISCLSFLLMKTLNRQRNPLVRSCNNRASLLHHGMTTLNYSHDGHLRAGMPTREKTPNVDDFRFEHL